MATESKVKNTIKELQKNMEKDPSIFEDEEFDPNTIRVSPKVISEEVSVIDELLASVPKGQGYYLKLYKEIRPNTHEFKLKIDSFENWTDLELEIAGIIRDYTLKDTAKWGSGTYRIIVHRKEGIRGPKYNPIDFYIDAQEMPGAKITTQSQTNSLNDLSSITNIIKTIREANPTISPAEIQKTMAESYQAGLKAQTEKENNNNNTMAVMMTALTSMMTAVLTKSPLPQSSIVEDLIKSLPVLLSALKELGIINPKKETTIPEMVKQLQDLGIYKQAKDIDPIKKLTEIKELISAVQSVSSFTQGERPSIFEKLVDSFAPQLPNFIDKITSTVDKVSELVKLQNESNVTPAALPLVSVPSTSTSTTSSSIPSNGGNETVMNTQFFDELYTLINNQDFSKHDILHLIINKSNHNVDITPDILSGKLNVDNLIQVIRLYGGPKFNEEVFLPKLETFINNFIAYIKSKSITSIQPIISAGYIARCSNCHIEYEFDKKEDFDIIKNEEKICDECKGKLVGV